MTLAEVSGPDVRRWHVQNALLQVWLRKPVQETTIVMTGWRALPIKGAVVAQSAS